MKLFKSHFVYSKSQRNGIFLLISILIVVQFIIFSINFDEVDTAVISSPRSKELQSVLDSLELISKTKTPYSSIAFNPNYLSDYKAYQLGMSVVEIDRLFSYRKSGKYINSVADFKKVTQVSDSLLKTIASYFKFPDWVTKKTSKQILNKKERKIIVKDINTASVDDLIKIKGIGPSRAKSIIKYRDLLGGYTYESQLKEVWGLPSDILESLLKEYKVFSKPILIKINVNRATAYEMSKIVYIDYKQAKLIVEYRKEVAEIQNLAELKTISNFPVDKFDLISLYLQVY